MNPHPDPTIPWFNSPTGIITFDSVCQDDVDALAAIMLRHFPVPATIGLIGTLGAGKTRLVQAIAAAARVDQTDVTSPTFTLLQTYQGFREAEKGGEGATQVEREHSQKTGLCAFAMHHLDAYRVHDEDEFLELGIDELFDDHDAWTLVEWADRFHTAMPRDTIWIRLLIDTHPDRRIIQMARPAGDDEPIRKVEQAFRANRSFPHGPS